MDGIDIGALRISANRRHVTMLVAIDTSISMSAKHRGRSRLQVASEGACNVIEKLGDGDHAAVLSFGDEISHVTDGVEEIDHSRKCQIQRKL